ncbi:MAG: hypothetical protein HOI20_16080 [Gemmatimonadetes bacterium]|nr:hypothetical protein [Gemmatimonadota bacterium]
MRIVFITIGLAIVACGDPHEKRVRMVMEGGEGREEMLMELLLGKGEVLPAVLPRLTDSAQPLPGRLALVDLVWKLYVRESDPRILTSLLGLLDDSAPEMRQSVVHALGNIGKEELVRPLLDQLQREAQQAVQLEILKAIEILDEWKVEGNWNFKIYGGDAFSPADRDGFVSVLQKIRADATVDTLEHLAEEFLEKMAGQLASEAEAQVVRADLEGALKLYDQALAIKPDSKNVHTSLGKFHYFNGERAKGLAALRVNGMVLQVPELETPPVIDGHLTDPVWAQATRLDAFYQNVLMVRAIPTEGRSEFYVYYSADTIYFALKAYEESTDGLVATHRTRDSQVWQDDGVELYIDTDLDQRSYWGVLANCIGTILDSKQSVVESRMSSDNSWNGNFQLATRIEPTYWSIEVALPFAEIDALGTEPGDVWGFNVTRVRIGNASEHGQFAPTYGRSLRPRLFGLLVFE